MNHNDAYNQQARGQTIVSRAKRIMSGIGLGHVVVDPFKGATNLLPHDKLVADDLALARRMGAMAGLRNAGKATLRPEARSQAEISPMIAQMVSGAIHSRYGSAIGDDFDNSYLRNATISRRELVERRNRHWAQHQA